MSTARGIAYSLTDTVLSDPVITRLDSVTHAGLFPKWLTEHVQGCSFMLLPLLPKEGQLIGVVVLYRKGGHSFTENEALLAQWVGPCVAVAIQGPSLPEQRAGATEEDPS